jgi:hypothetical protein
VFHQPLNLDLGLGVGCDHSAFLQTLLVWLCTCRGRYDKETCFNLDGGRVCATISGTRVAQPSWSLPRAGQSREAFLLYCEKASIVYD